MAEENSEDKAMKWYVLRDLKRSNAKLPAYRMLESEHVEVFTPMKWVTVTRQGKRVRTQQPFMPDLLFAHTTREALTPLVEKTPTLQYRYVRGGTSVSYTHLTLPTKA